MKFYTNSRFHAHDDKGGPVNVRIHHKDISLAEFGRKEFENAETEMLVLMALREELGEAFG